MIDESARRLLAAGRDIPIQWNRVTIAMAALIEVISPIVHVHDRIVTDQVLLLIETWVDTPFMGHETARRSLATSRDIAVKWD
jgi:hypothetical protein